MHATLGSVALPPTPHPPPCSHPQVDQDLQKANAEARAAGKDITYIYRTLYLPEKGMFAGLEEDLHLGTYLEVGGWAAGAGRGRD